MSQPAPKDAHQATGEQVVTREREALEMSIAYGVSWTDERPIRRVTAIALVALMLLSLGGIALRQGTTVVPVIIRSTVTELHRAERLVVAAGGRIDLPLAIISGFKATVPTASLAHLAASAAIWQITPDAPVHMNGMTSYGYDNGDDGSPYLVAKAVNATSAWGKGYTGKGIDIALIDTGVVPLPELAGRVINGPDLSPESQFDATRYMDTYGHGTFMAGLIAGRDPSLTAGKLPGDSNYTGVAPDARIVNIKVSTYNGSSDVSQILAAIDWVVQHKNSDGLNIRVLNLSFGTDGAQDYRLDPLTYAAEVAWRAGIVVVAAGGNQGFGNQRLNNPAYDPFVIAVGADDMRGSAGVSNDMVPDFSARGTLTRGVDVVAPGKSVISLRAAGSFIDVNHPEGRVGTKLFRGSGTSEGTAVTSGAVALMLQARPNLTPDQVKYLLRKSALELPREDDAASQGEGLIRLDKSMTDPIPADSLATQTFERATGTGSLDGSRGSQRLTDNGVVLDGEKDIFGQTFSSADWAPKAANYSSWSGGSWMGRDMTGNAWTTDAYGRKSWSGSSWTGSSWTGSSWTGSSWTGSSWTGSSWTGSSWTGSSWTGSSWTGSSWTGSSWTGSSWTGSSWTGSSWTGSSWTGSSWTSQFWSGSGWGP
jgi:serine protease AprX